MKAPFGTVNSMNRASIVSELARVLQVNEAEAERILRAFAQVLGPVAAEVPPYFERYFEAQIQLVLQKIDDLERSMQQQIASLRQSTDIKFQGLDHRFQAIDQRFQAVEQRFQAVDQRFQNLEQRIDAIERRLDRLEKWLFSVLVMILSGILAIIFRIYFGG